MTRRRVPCGRCVRDAVVGVAMLLALSAKLVLASSPVVVLTNPLAQISEFGWSVAANRRMAVVGAPWRWIGPPIVGQAQIVGEAYLFDLKTGALLQTLSNPNTLPNPNGSVSQDRFAYAVALLGTNTVAVGAPDAFIVGRIYLFDASTGELRHTVLPPSGGSTFGAVLAVDGNRLLVAGTLNVTPQDPLRGAVFLLNGDTGEVLQTFVDSVTGDYSFGVGLALHDNAVLVGAAGGAYLFDAVSGALVHHFDVGESAVALTRDRVFVGNSNADAVYVFDRSTGALLRTLTPPSPMGQYVFGGTLAVIGQNLLIGQRGGPAYLFAGHSGRPLNTFPAPSPGSLSVFGSPVASAGNRALVGAVNYSGGAATSATDYGAVYLFAPRSRH